MGSSILRVILFSEFCCEGQSFHSKLPSDPAKGSRDVKREYLLLFHMNWFGSIIIYFRGSYWTFCPQYSDFVFLFLF